MNLTTDPWIPVLWNDGATRAATLANIFVRGHDIRDLAVRPHERIALMRLFLCVAHAALDGPGDREEWQDCLARLPAAAGNYLQRWVPAFELFGESQRFLQVPNLKAAKAKDEEGNSVSKLDMALATGNNPTLFDNSGGDGRAFPPEQLALMLLTFQCFSLQTPFGVANWNGKLTRGSPSHDNPTGAAKNGKTYAGDAPCVGGGMIHAIIIRQESLLHTIWANLPVRESVLRLPGYEGWGCPVWEKPPAGPEDVALARTYLGRLVPFTRAILLSEDFATAVISNGLHYVAPTPDGVREIMGTVFVPKSKQADKRSLLRADVTKALWRQIHPVVVLRKAGEDVGGPLALTNLDGTCDFDLWVGALIPANSAKIVDVIEGSYPLPAAMLQSTGRERYEKGVQFAEQAEGALKRAVTLYYEEIGDKSARRDALQNKATFQFWTQAEGDLPLLLAAVQSADPLPDAMAWRRSAWGQAVNHAARLAYETACPHETGRQLQAFVKGLAVLFPNSANHSN
jgi:CRISPR system Cascade subunit CasA